MKVIVLAGGLGSRLAEYTKSIPKPMVTIGGKPIIWHILRTYAFYGHNDFYLALGYKAEIIKEYFLNYRSLNADFTVDLQDGHINFHETDTTDWKVSLIETGLKTMTGGRVKKMKPFIGNETFMLTYGDGVANIDINKVIKFHKSHGKMVTVTAVRPTARFGELEMKGDEVTSFQEKPQTNQGWINGGYFIIEPEFFNFIKEDATILERDPLEKAAKSGELMAYCHEGYWQCMDTQRDKDSLEELWDSGNAPWDVYNK